VHEINKAVPNASWSMIVKAKELQREKGMMKIMLTLSIFYIKYRALPIYVGH
jgi:hypothetical protein